VIDASPPAIKPAARHGEPVHVFPANGAAADGRPADGGRDRLDPNVRRGRRRRRWATEPQPLGCGVWGVQVPTA
jgi:hypothetical protein